MTDFEALYKLATDPWSVAHLWYERRKRSIMLASMPLERFHHALELGCGTGETTYLLASMCAQVTAVDVSPTAAARCRQRVQRSGASNVDVQVLELPMAWPDCQPASFDLVLVSELAYYFSRDEFSCFAERCMDSLAPQGYWVMCHYKPDFHDRYASTDEIHDGINANRGLRRILAHDDEQFRLDVWRKLGKE